MYDLNIEYFRSLRERAQNGKVLIRGDELPWEQNRNSRSKFYFHRQKPDTALMNVTMFVQDIQTHSGEHRHQGGVVIYVLEGEGWTTVDGVEHHWKQGDLLLLPIKPDGVSHQHFNANPEKPAKWLAFLFDPFREYLAEELVQVTPHPDWHGD
ncbi:MAG: hypothetical protein HW416_3438 [Chloroflexi bacterium]|nr:hypothetical protein [Chloroflexota bacterium]